MWFYAQNGHKVGPVPFEEIVNLINAEIIAPTSLVCKQGEKPCRAGAHPELQEYFPNNIQQPTDSKSVSAADSVPSPISESAPTPSTAQAKPTKRVLKQAVTAHISNSSAALRTNNKKKSNNTLFYGIIGGIVGIVVLALLAISLLGKSKTEDSPAKENDVAYNVQESEEDSPNVESNEDDKITEDDKLSTEKQEEENRKKQEELKAAKEREENERLEKERNEKIKAENAQNREQAKQPGKIIVFTEGLRNKYKTADDLVPGFSDSTPDFHDRINFWSCLFSDKILDKLGDYEPALKRKIRETREEMKIRLHNFDYYSFNKDVLLSCKLKPDSNINANDESAMNDWVDFTAVYNQYTNEQSFYMDGRFLIENDEIKYPEVHSYLQHGYRYWVPTDSKEENFKVITPYSEDIKWLIRKNMSLYYDNSEGVYSKIKFALKTKPEIMKDIFLHPDDYRLELYADMHYSNEEPIRLFSVKTVENNNGSINEALPSSVPLQSHLFNYYKCRIRGFQVRNIKTDRIIAITTSNSFDLFQTAVVNVNDVIYNHPEGEERSKTAIAPSAQSGYRTTHVQPGGRPTQPSDQEDDEPDNPNRMVKTIDGVKFAFRWIPPGVFTMGSPDDEEGRNLNEKQHKVKISNGFWMMETEVTQIQWEALTGKRNSYSSSKDNYPIENVTWEECNKYCHRAATFGLPLELPTEAQWEYACRAGTTGPYAGDLDQLTWYHDNSGNHSCSVKMLKPNEWGLYGMHGNVAEWCADWCGVYPSKPVIDPTGPEEGTKRMTRGGSWGAPKEFCRSALRGGLEPNRRTVGLGFRCVINKGKEEKNK